MAKRKGSSVSRPRSRNKMAKGGSEAREADRGSDDKKFDQLRRKFSSLEGKRTKLLEKEHTLEVQRPELEEKEKKLEARRCKLEAQFRKLEAQEHKMEEHKRKLEEPLPPLRSEVEQLQQSLLPESIILKDLCSSREVENAQRLDKLPLEVWEKILDHLDENDLFPLALSCRYFRQKQKELVERTRQKGKPCRALKTTLHEWPVKDQPASAEYLRFCSEEKIPIDCVGDREDCINMAAAFHGHLPLLQELVNPAYLDSRIPMDAGESSSSQSLLLLFVALASDSFLSSSQRAEAKWRPCSG